jgi:DNA polymerase-4
MDVYRAESHRIFEIVERLAGGLIQQVSVDEGYIDLSERCQAEDADASLQQAEPLARELKHAIHSERQLTATIGIASNKLLAKLASDFQKPDGLTLVRERDKVAWLRPMPVRALHGVGRVTEEALHRANLRTIGDLQDHRGDLRAWVGSWAAELKRFAFGEDDRPLELGDEVKSISAETTFPQDTEHRPILRACLRESADEIAGKLQRQRLAAHTVQVKVRYGDFTTLTRQLSLEEPMAEARELYRIACWLLARDRLVSRPLRLLGIGVSGLVEPSGEQLTLAFAKTSRSRGKNPPTVC